MSSRFNCGPTQELGRGFILPESPRWYKGELWLTDIFAGQVHRFVEGLPQTVRCFEGDSPSGLGFLPNGTPLVVSMQRKQILALDSAGDRIHADVTHLNPAARLNDMVVDPLTGRSFVDLTVKSLDPNSREDNGDAILLVEPNGDTKIAATGLLSPNGLALTEDGGMLIVAETRGRRITAFTVNRNGALTHRRVIAQLTGRPDGICLDEAGNIWIGCLDECRFLRIDANGNINGELSTGDSWAIACVLGGIDRRQLFICTTHTDHDRVRQRDASGAVDVVAVDVPGSGTP